MAGNQLHSLFQPQPFSGKPDEDIELFLSQLDSAICVNEVRVADRGHVHFLRLRLAGAALNFFDSLTLAQTDTLDLSKAQLRARYVNPNRQAMNRMTFQCRKFNEDHESVEDFLTELKRLSVQAYPEAERVARIREAFMYGLPNRLKKKVLSRPAAVLVDDLAELISRTLVIDKICPTNDLVSAFNEVNCQPESRDIFNMVTELQKGQDEFRREILEIKRDQVKRQEQPTTWAENETTDNGNQQRYESRFQANAQPPTRAYQSRGYPRNQSYNNQGFQNQRQFVPYESAGRGRANGYCRNCGKFGHFQRECFSRPQPQRGVQNPFQQKN